MTPAKEALYEKTLSCVHCVLCLPACPTYETFGHEAVAPRGQVYNIRAMLEGRLDLTASLSRNVYDCLACRACESVCPSGVEVGSIVEATRGLIAQVGKEKPWVRFSDFGDNALVFDLYFWVKPLTEICEVQTSIRFRIDDLFRKAGIVIAFPQRDVHFDASKPVDIRLVQASTGAEEPEQSA